MRHCLPLAQRYLRTAVRGAAVVLLLGIGTNAEIASGQNLPEATGVLGDVTRDPKTGRLVVVPPKTTLHVCVDMAQNPACDLTSLQTALNRLAANGEVVLHPGVYREAAIVRRHGTHIRALPGAALVGVAIGGKGALVVHANGVVIEGLTCSGISVPSFNGACVRLHGKDLTLRGVYFYDSEEGLLTGKNAGRIVIEDSRFENLGRKGRSHGIYVNGGELIIRRSVFLASKEEGHEIKSRAARTVIEDNVIASLGGQDSYLIDISNGGEAIIRRNLLQEGPVSANYSAIAFAREGDRYKDSRLVIEDNVILMERRHGIVVRAKGHKAAFARNFVVGDERIYRFGAVDAACGQADNVCLPRPEDAKGRPDLPLPNIAGLEGILAEIGLLQ